MFIIKYLSSRLKAFCHNFITSGIPDFQYFPHPDKVIVTNIFSFIGATFTIFFSILNIIHTNYIIGFIELSAGIICIFNLFLLRIFIKVELAGNVILFLLITVMTAVIISGGMEHTGIIWIYTLIPLAMFLKRKNKGFLWITSFVFIMLLLLLLSHINLIKIAYSPLEIRQAIASFLAVSLMVYFYEKSREDNEAKMLISAKEKLLKGIQLKNLETANHELSSFAHIIAHDLKSPLSGISAIADLLKMNNENTLSDSDKELLEKIKDSTHKMFFIIDSLLEYAKIGNTHKKVEAVNLNDVVKDIISMLHLSDRIQITVSSHLPTIKLVKAHAYQIFQNLIQNAVKYMGREEGKISINVNDKNQDWEFSISDNGMGIPEKNLNKIFQIFFTTDIKNNHHSNGIGLSTVKKIIEVYGGNIWVNSEINEGSTFYFTLPKA